jgi:hypothetical protein
MTREPVKHYSLPGTNLQVIDVIRAKMTDDEWRKFCWASAVQYTFRLLDKGEPDKDAGKAITYLQWFRAGKP